MQVLYTVNSQIEVSILLVVILSVYSRTHHKLNSVQLEIIDPKERADSYPDLDASWHRDATHFAQFLAWDAATRSRRISRPQPQTGTGPTYQPSKKQMQTPELSTHPPHPTRKLSAPKQMGNRQVGLGTLNSREKLDLGTVAEWGGKKGNKQRTGVEPDGEEDEDGGGKVGQTVAEARSPVGEAPPARKGGDAPSPPIMDENGLKFSFLFFFLKNGIEMVDPKAIAYRWYCYIGSWTVGSVTDAGWK
jgi:hypothetical protein